MALVEHNVHACKGDPAPVRGIVVDPSAMVTLVIDTPNGQRGINAINCRYVPAWLNPPVRVVAVEIIHDGNTPIPMQPYFCDANLLTTEIFPAPALRHVRPYAPLAPDPPVRTKETRLDEVVVTLNDQPAKKTSKAARKRGKAAT
jgi:hypothetical protein